MFADPPWQKTAHFRRKALCLNPPPLRPSPLPPQQGHCQLFHLPLPTLLSTMSRHPTAKWAQRSDKVHLTIELPDAKDVKLKLEPEGKFVFSATKDGVPYGIDIELIDKVNVEESKVSVGLRSIVYVIKKSERKWWTRLLKQEGRPPAFLKVDWDKWVDEEEEDKKGLDFDDMDFSKLDMGGDGDLDMDDFKDGDEDVGTKGDESKSEAEPTSEAVGEDRV